MFDPKTDKYPYPEDTAAHYIHLKENVGTVFDETYPYFDESKKMKRKQGLTRFLLRVFAFPLCRIRLGLRVKGRAVLKKYKDQLRQGVVSCSNHVHFWDFIATMYALRPFKPYVLVWPENVRGENRNLIRSVRGVPVPDSGHRALHAMSEQTKNKIKSGEWVHIYAEGSMWDYYCPIRPFKDGAAYYAAVTDRPLLPLAFSYRKPGFIRRVLFHQIALFNLCIGEPLFPNRSLAFEERKRDLVRRSHEAVCRLAGIDPAQNPYPPRYQQSRRVHYED